MSGWGIGLGRELGLSPAVRDSLVAEASARGYASAWSNAGSDAAPFADCGRWLRAGLGAGISVVPLDAWDEEQLAQLAVQTAAAGEGFVLGVGSGRATSGALRLVREGVASLRRRAPGVAVHVGALGPRMLELAGEVADGAALNWCGPEQVAWSRERVAAGAERTGRDPASIRIVEYIRVAVSEDVEAARLALATAMLGYALARPGRSKDAGYRGHFARMGFDTLLGDLEARRDGGEPLASLAAAVPPDLLARVGAFGGPAEVRRQLDTLARGLDLPIARVVAVGDPERAARATIAACAPLA